VSLVTSLAALTSETIAFSVGPKVIAARETTEDGTVVIAARRPVVQFPDFDKFLKQEFSRRVTVDAAAGKEALLRTQAFVDSDLKSVKVVLHAKEIQLLARHAGKAEDYIPIVSEKEADEDDPFAEPETVSFYVNHGFLVDFFEASSGEVVLASDPKVPLIGLFNGNRVAILTQLEAS
jgi:DNA polymerase III sliding clamp (beta) subunit (PCNA family)